MKLLSAILDLLFPPRCVFCRKLLPGGEPLVCPDCAGQLSRMGSVREVHGDFFKICVAPLRYEGIVRESLLRYKFHGCSGYAETYGPMLADCIRSELSGQFDVLTWVPLSRKRLRERGYDQARLLAEAAGELLGIAPVQLLVKQRNTARQSATGSAEKRRANISGAYRTVAAELIAGQRVLIVDDIVTTGATLSECARMLREAGASQVLCAALAATPD